MDAFAADLATRLSASARIGLSLYGDGPPKWTRYDASRRKAILAAAFVQLEAELDPLTIAAATDPCLNSYGAWNPVVLFLGLTGGTQRPDIARAHEHVIGYPQVFLRTPGDDGRMMRGNPWFPAELSDITELAMRLAAARSSSPALREWARDRYGEFRRAAASALMMLNLSSEQVAIGGARNIDATNARERLERHLSTFRPRVLVTVQEDVEDQLRRMYPAAMIPVRLRGDTSARSARLQIGRHAIDTVFMPVHPNAKGTHAATYRGSKHRVSEAIAEALAETA